MSWILDICILLILGLTIFFAVKNGFVKTALSTLSFALAVLITACLLNPVRNAFMKTQLAENITAETQNSINDYIKENRFSGVKELIDKKPEEFRALLSAVGIEISDIEEWYETEVKDSDEAQLRDLSRKIAEPAVYAVVTLVSVIVIYICARLVLLILTKILDAVAKLPVLKTANRVLGLLLGIVLAVVRISLFCLIIRVLVDNSEFIGWDFLTAIDTENTLLFRLFEKINIFSFLLE